MKTQLFRTGAAPVALIWIAGSAIKTTSSHEVAVRMDDGSLRVVQQASAPAGRVGDHVKVVNGAIVAN